MVTQNPVGSSLLRLSGAFIAVFSLVIGLLVLFVIPGACTFVSGIQLILLGFLFIIGVLAFLLGQVLVWKRRRVEANPKGAPEGQ